MTLSDEEIIEFLGPQLSQYAGKDELAPGWWLLLAIPVGDDTAALRAGALMSKAPFHHETGVSDDDRWTLYYVSAAECPHAVSWLEDLRSVAAGEIRPIRPDQAAILKELVESKGPHRLAQRMVEAKLRGEIGTGILREGPWIRTLLDRMHELDPLVFAAFKLLLVNHLIDMIVLMRQLIPEDIVQNSDIVRSGLSRDPFLQTRQDAAAEIRKYLLSFYVINPLDQQRNTSVTNPYAAFLEIVEDGGNVRFMLEGIQTTVARRDLLTAVRAIRRRLYRGEKFADVDTQAPWVTGEIALPLRAVRQILARRSDLLPMDGLYFIERAVSD